MVARRPRKQCCVPGCSRLTEGSRCEEHAQQQLGDERAAYAARMGGDRQWYSKPAWRTFRAGYLAGHPLCQRCRQLGRRRAAVEVHHVKPRRDRPDLAFDAANMMGLCKPCHQAIEGQRGDGG